MIRVTRKFSLSHGTQIIIKNIASEGPILFPKRLFFTLKFNVLPKPSSLQDADIIPHDNPKFGISRGPQLAGGKLCRRNFATKRHHVISVAASKG